ncbi:MAG: right-handed parallel beta-helix repeat-containing protein [Candidatus Marinimicrobia bacterium]|nr:right-handed parallel beta-helix repeat-containing protein [Candidatus Neomarinimicrobiota bacterium]
MVSLAWHSPNYTPGSSDLDNPALYNQRTAVYGVGGIPHTQWNGVEETVGGYPGGNWEPMYNSFIGIYNSMATANSPYLMDLSGGLDGNNGVWEVTLTMDFDYNSNNHNLEVFVFEDRIYSYWSGASQWEDARFVMRDWLDSHPVTISGTGESQTFSGSFPLQANWNLSMVGVVVIVQNMTTKQVKQADFIYIGPNYYFLYDYENDYEMIPAGETSIIASTLSNVGQNSDDYTITLASDLPEGWSSSLFVDDVNYGNGATITVENFGSAEISVVTNTLPGSEALGTNTVSVASAGNPDLSFTADFSTICYDEVIHVDSGYSGEEFGWLDKPFNTIQEGIDEIQSGYTVFVHAGNYVESITLKDGIILSGEAADATILSGASGNIITGADNCTISGFTIGGTNANGAFGYFSLDAENVRISENIISNITYGVQGGGYANINTVINNNDFFDCSGTAIFMSANANPIIRNNIFQTNSCAVKLYGSSVSTAHLDNNLFYENTTNLYGEISFGDGNLIDVNPLFDADGLHLNGNSPCIDAGYFDENDLDPDGTIRDIGAFYFEQTQQGMLGDVNQDEIINILDILLVVNFILENETPDDYESWAADYNEDGAISILDIMALITIILNG